MPGVAPVEPVDWVFEESSDLAAEISTITSRISPLHRPESPATTVMSVQQVVVVSPTPYETPQAPLDLSSGTYQVGSQESYISSVQLSGESGL